VWTADWWWDTQDKLNDEGHEGATIAPVIIATDETQLSTFRGDQSAYPVYLTLGNIAKDVRRKPSTHATVLIGYLPTSSLLSFSNAILRPLADAGRNGVDMICADGFVRRIFPLLAAYVADYPDQCKATCVKQGWCPKCRAHRDSLGSFTQSLWRDPTLTARVLRRHEQGTGVADFERHGLRPVYKPF
ncbi:hypothetical protein PHLGIDRAFT_80994, partial [Phlebiopsis gigantea 11061_1 CR5-6]